MSYSPAEFPAELRTYKCDGSHGLTHTRELTFSDADETQVELSVEFCADECCAKMVRTSCQHASNSWHYTSDYKPAEPGDLDGEGNSALLCDFCGKDGT
jgi:hypothetical protein